MQGMESLTGPRTDLITEFNQRHFVTLNSQRVRIIGKCRSLQDLIKVYMHAIY